ncbi:MAG: hypothetical protein EB059_00275 [Alphaproteobacteria bacterium]|nr:hypothetical protein [Alphaproteobacteria bacterium]
MANSLDDILKSRFGRFDRFDMMRWLLRGHKTINKSEQMSLLSLLAYTAVETDGSVEELQQTFLDSFSISRVEDLKSDDYNEAVHFLMEWKDRQDALALGPMDQQKAG